MKKYKQNETKNAPLQRVTLRDLVVEALEKTRYRLSGDGAETTRIRVDYDDAIDAVLALTEQVKLQAQAAMLLELANRWHRGVNVNDLDRLVEQYAIDDQDRIIDHDSEE